MLSSLGSAVDQAAEAAADMAFQVVADTVQEAAGTDHAAEDTALGAGIREHREGDIQGVVQDNPAAGKQGYQNVCLIT